jgi:ribosomal protein L40E
MKIIGGGGSFENRIYELELQLAWRLIQACAAEMKIEVSNLDEENYLLEGKVDRKEFNTIFTMFTGSTRYVQIHVQQLDAKDVQVIFDIHKKQMEVYDWGRGDKLVDEFYDLFEQKMDEALHSVVCSKCGARVSVKHKFCPECGAPLKEA